MPKKIGTNFLILGAGTAGCVLARRLSDEPDTHVTLLEAGGPATDPSIADPKQWPFMAGTKLDWGYKTTPQLHTDNRVHEWPRGKVIGGTSSINAMAHVRGHPNDFNHWAEHGCAGWGYSDLLPYFIRSETSPYGETPAHGNSGPIKLMQPSDPHPLTQCYRKAALSLGYDPIHEHNQTEMSGPTLNTLTIVDGNRQSTADAYLGSVRNRKNLEIIDRCFIEMLLIDGRNQCQGVVYEKNNETHELKTDGSVILCAGTIGSPQLLMCSGIGPAEDLNNLGISVKVDLPGIGQNLHDHLLSGGNVYKSRKPVPPTDYQHSESLLYVNRDTDNLAPEMMFACVVLPVVTERFTAPSPGSAYTIMYGVTAPRSRGKLTLQSADPRVHPLLDPNYLSDPYDREVYLEALEFARRLGASEAFEEWRDEEILPGTNVVTMADKLAFNAKVAFTHHHPVGTCKMGTDALAVVAPDLSVRGIDKLFVVDGSIIPRITTGPINASIIAIAERASDLFLGKQPAKMDIT